MISGPGGRVSCSRDPPGRVFHVGVLHRRSGFGHRKPSTWEMRQTHCAGDRVDVPCGWFHRGMGGCGERKHCEPVEARPLTLE